MSYRSKKTVVGVDNKPLTAYDSISAACGLYSFSINAFESVSEGKDTNYVFSPFGTAALFTMLQEGSSGKTYEELQKVMCVNSDIMAGMVKELNKYDPLSDDGNSSAMKMGNMLMLDKKNKLRLEYDDFLKSEYKIETMNQDFSKVSCKKIIDDWAASHVRNSNGWQVIPVTFSNGAHVVSTVRFKGAWLRKFDKKYTKQKCFHQYDGRETTVDMMAREDRYYYMENDTMQAVSVPFVTRGNVVEGMHFCSLYVLLPREGYTIKDVLKLLRGHYLDYFHENMRYQMVNLRLPRFGIETTYDAKHLMNSLGARHLESFNGITRKQQSLSHATLSGKITVNEYGTVDDSSNINEYVGYNYPTMGKHIVYNFNANRPFIYMLVNEDNGTILFMGQYSKGQLGLKGTWHSIMYCGEEEKTEPRTYDRGDDRIVVHKYLPYDQEGEILKSKGNRYFPEIDHSKAYDVVEKIPSFPGGNKELMEYLKKNMKYPPKAEVEGIQGRVVLQFIVKADGHIENVRIAKSVDPLLDKEAIRLIKAMPRWEPGMQGGEKVDVRYTLPVTFRLK
jgi:protein TonB